MPATPLLTHAAGAGGAESSGLKAQSDVRAADQGVPAKQQVWGHPLDRPAAGKYPVLSQSDSLAFDNDTLSAAVGRAGWEQAPPPAWSPPTAPAAADTSGSAAASSLSQNTAAPPTNPKLPPFQGAPARGVGIGRRVVDTVNLPTSKAAPARSAGPVQEPLFSENSHYSVMYQAMPATVSDAVVPLPPDLPQVNSAITVHLP